jgi:ubiquitin-like protein Pup
MSGQEKRSGGKRKTSEKADVAPDPKVSKKGEALKKDLDELIDEIDEVLEDNAEEFVKNYVQRGGE